MIDPKDVIDMHVHVGLAGDKWPEWGHFSEKYKKELTFQIFLKYVDLKPDQVNDQTLFDRTVEIVKNSSIGRVVLLALDHYFDTNGNPDKSKSHLWVHNDYVLHLQETLKEQGFDKALFGASVHPYDPDFEERVALCVDKGAVLLKWVPSAQNINLADSRIGAALQFLATAKNGQPLPLLLHCGMEHAILPVDEKAKSFDLLSWTSSDSFWNFWRFSKKWYTPDVVRIRQNLELGLNAGAVVILTHCGLPYFEPKWLGLKAEHSDFKVVEEYLNRYKPGVQPGACYTDVSALCTPFRRGYFSDVVFLPANSVLYGSDFPTPVFEMAVDAQHKLGDFRAVMEGHLERVIIPEGNLMDVNFQQMQHYFGDHAFFTNANSLLGG